MNQNSARPHFEEESYDRNKFKQRNVNFFILQTPHHVMSVVLPLDIGWTCTSSFAIFDRATGPEVSNQLVEDIHNCPQNYQHQTIFPFEGRMSL